MSEIRFSSDIRVKPVLLAGYDTMFARAAWAVPPDSQEERDAPAGRAPVLKTCMRLGHNSPFEHGLMSVYAEMPGVVWWQLTRHRFMSLDSEDFSFSLESGRYKELDPEFYVPPLERPIAEPEGFRPMRPALVVSEGVANWFRHRTDMSCRCAWNDYQDMIGQGVAREVARLVLPNWALYCDGYVTAKPLTWLQFFSKRRSTADTKKATFPQWEIESFCSICESLFSANWPETYAAFVANGRVAP